MRYFLIHTSVALAYAVGTARSVLTAAAVVAIGVILSSCAAIPDFGPAPQPKTSESLASKQSLASGDAQWPTEDWWKSFGDSQLDELMGEAVARSPTMADARARLQEALARSGAAQAALYPTAAGNASADHEKLSYHSIFPAAAVPRGWNNLDQATLDFGWELDFWGKNRDALDAAISESKAANADVQAAELLLTTTIAQVYVELHYLYDLRAVTSETVRNRQDSLQLAHERLSQGLGDDISVQEATARVDLAQADLGEVDERIKLSRNELAALLGQGPDRGLAIAPPTLSTRSEIGLPPRLSLDILGRKPEVVAARWRVESAARRIDVARTDFYPNVNLVAFIGFQSLGLSKFTATGSDIGGVGPALHLPIFEGGLLRANYRGARAEYDAAVAIYDETLTQTLREVADAARSLDALSDRRAATDAALSRSETAYKLARARYQGGLADYQSVLTAEDIKLQAQMADAAIHNRAYFLDVALVKALGGGFDSRSTHEAKEMP